MMLTKVVSSMCLAALCAASAVGEEGFGWRSYMLDVSRHFFTVKEIERTLDAMAVAGLNVFHWHLTDSAGWRLQIDAYPELTGPAGAARQSSTVRTSTMTKDDTDGPYGPFFYTKDEARHIVAYASARGIEVVPEIDIPGHSGAAVRACGSLGCMPGRPSNQLCVGKDTTLRMYEKIVDEVLELFPSETIHLGGDECSYRNWKTCPDCQRRIKELGLRGEKGLQGWFMRHFAEYLERKGRRMVAWDDVVDFDDLPKSVIVMAYRDRKNLGPVAARRGYDVVETSGYYFDYLQGLADDPHEYQPFGRNCSWRWIMSRDPAADYPGELRKRLKGVGCCMWTELVGDIAGVEWRTWPRAAALAQVLWDGPTDDAVAFAAKLSATSEKLRRLGVNVAPLGPYFREFPELEPGVRCLWLREETAKMLPNPLDESVLRFEGTDAQSPPDKVFAKRDAAYPDGAYLLDMDWMCVEVTASGSAGFRNALRQLGKLARRKKGGVLEFPSCRLAFGDVPERPVAASEFAERTFTDRSGRSISCRLREPRHMMLGANYPLFVFNGVPEAKALSFVDRRERRNEEAFYCLLSTERTQEEIDGLCDEMAWTIRNLNGDRIQVLTAKDVEPKEYDYCDPFSPEDRRAVIDPAARGELRLSPLFASCGVVFGGCDVTNGLSVAWRKKGTDAAWQRTDLYWFADVANARGVIRGLDEDTEYEAQALCGDMVCAQGTFRTWASDVPIARTVEIDPATAKFPIVVSDRGTPTGWIRYVAKGGQPIVNREEAMTFVVTNAAYVVFDDMKIVGGRAQRVFHLKDSTGVRIRHCDISGWGFKGVSRFDDRGRVYERWDEKLKRYVGGDGQHAIYVDVGMKETVIERCWIHDPAGRSHAWRYSHPHGPMAMMMSRPDGATVVRWNDFVGSDLHRWDDGIGGNMNFWEDGGFNRNAEVYGNFICFANDDCIELDGGQQNVLCEGNRFEGSYMGVSVQGCVVSPSYVVDNLVSGIGDEFGAGCTALKPNGFDFHKRGAPVCVFADNVCWGPGRVFDPQRRAGPTGRFVQSGNRLVAESEPVVPDYPRRPAGFLLDVARMDVGRDHSPRTIRVRLTGGATEIPYEIAKNDAFDWLQVTPARGVLREGSELKVSFDEAKMRERPLYRGAFLVRTPEGLSRPVTVYASTDWTQPLKCDRPGEVAVYAYPKDATTDKDGYGVYSFDVPKAGRYYFMAFAQGEGRTEIYAAVDGDEPKPTGIQPGRDFPAWTIIPAGLKNGPSCLIRYFDFKPGRHTLRIKPWHGRHRLQAVVLTDSPGSFEPKLGGNACEALQTCKDVPQRYLDEIATAKRRFDAWKGTDAVVAFPVVTDVHSFRGEIVPNAWRDAKNHIRIARQAAVVFGADFTADLGDLGFDCFGTHRTASTREQAEIRLRAEETLYRDFPVPTIFCIGNHDYGRADWKPGEHVTAAEFGRRFNGPARAKGVSFVGPDSLDYGYWDIPGKNCRVIFLNTAELAPRRGISPEQVAFFRRALETLPKGSVALALSHITPNYSMTLWANAKPRTYRGMDELRTVAEAFVAAGGRFAGFVSGDSHFDWQTTVNGVAYLTTQGYGSIGAGELPKRDGVVHRPRGEDKCQCLIDVVAVKSRSGETRLFRIGAGGAEADRVLHNGFGKDGR